MPIPVKKTFAGNRSWFFVISLLLLFYGINNSIWLKLDDLPPTSDEAFHLLSSLKYSEILTSPSPDIFLRLLDVDKMYPPFFTFCAALMSLVIGHSIIALVMTNMVFAAALFFSVYFIGRKYEDKYTGLFAAFILSMYPYVFGLSRTFLLDFALLAMVGFSLCCLVYSDNLRRSGYSALFGVSLGIGILTKQTFVIFLVAPLAMAVINIVFNRESIHLRKKSVFNLGVALVLAAIIAGIWHLPKLFELQSAWNKYQYAKTHLFGPSTILSSVTYYAKLLTFDQIAPFFTALFLIGSVFLLKNKAKSFLIFLLWFILPYALFIFAGVRYMTDTIPALLPIALISGAGILKIKNQFLKRSAILLTVVLALIQYGIISYTSPEETKMRVSFPTSIKIRDSFFKRQTSFDFSQSCHILPIGEFFYHFPRKGDWKLEQIIEAIELNNPGSKYSEIGVTDAAIDCERVAWFDPDPGTLGDFWRDNFMVVNNSAVEYFVNAARLPYKVISLLYSNKDWMHSAKLDFIISVKSLEYIAPDIAGAYSLILKTAVPDESPVYVYKKRGVNE
ncbi:MAG: glycosyltransferase family 39 protein [Candidatus Omnitrophica bacterium]|nr:glycosyltransferase family 39 protein [Candidatus Omnitrophota bacterium]MDD5552729.1 glycosyltransferase family 39 protein [Candidatus Omnitrophota bacterium]